MIKAAGSELNTSELMISYTMFLTRPGATEWLLVVTIVCFVPACKFSALALLSPILGYARCESETRPFGSELDCEPPAPWFGAVVCCRRLVASNAGPRGARVYGH